MKTKFFTITENVCEPNIPAQEANPDQTLKFRLLDDDGETYFIGQMRPTQSERLFIPLDNFGVDYGCTSIEIFENGQWAAV